MNGYLNAAEKRKARLQAKNVQNPQELISKDLNAFAVVSEYRHSLQFGAKDHILKLREVNKDLLPYFNFCDREYIRQHANTEVND